MIKKIVAPYFGGYCPKCFDHEHTDDGAGHCPLCFDHKHTWAPGNPPKDAPGYKSIWSR